MLPRVKAEPEAQHRVAVVLNRKARGVSERLVRRVGKLVPEHDIFVSGSLADSREIARTIVERGYDAVLLGGGDGTFSQCATDLRQQARRRGVDLPSLGVLRLGTGNAMASTLNASSPTDRGLRHDLHRATLPETRSELNLLEVDGRLAPFAGVGLDAQILEDFIATTRFLDGAGVGGQLGPGVRYALAVALRSTPRFLFSRRDEVVAVNLGAPARRIGAGGLPVGKPIGRGEILYRGRCSIAAGSTIPFYGLGLKVFPFAQARSDRFHLRCASASTAEILGHLPSIWRGEYASDTIADFLVEKVELRLQRAVPIQIGGDLQPIPRDRLVMSLSPRPFRVIA